MQTLHLSKNDTKKAADILKNGGIVAIPTETVYGLAASAFNEKAISKIFKAKGRPADNPLIVHISNLKDIYEVVSSFPETAQKLAEKFWPGPLTMILPKNPNIPSIVTAGMDSVAVRFPSNKIAQEIISFSGVPLVAPSANLSGSPSPTEFLHVCEDLEGRADALVDGGSCCIGLESTVISLLNDTVSLLRPGAITVSQIKSIVGDVQINNGVYLKLDPKEKVLSPGMKYKHYAPKTKVILVSGCSEKYAEFLNAKQNENILALCFDEDIPYLTTSYISYGSISNFKEQAKNLFNCLRKADKLNINTIYAHSNLKGKDVDLAVYNRLIRSAGFDIIKL